MKKVTVYLLIAIFISPIVGTAKAEENKPFELIDIEVREWFSSGESSWQISFGSNGKSILEYKDIDAPISIVTARIKPGPYWLTLEGSGGFGEIDSGTQVDTDKLGSFVFSESESDVDGDVLIVDVNVALRIVPWDKNSPSYLDAFVGVQYYQEKLHMTNGVQTINSDLNAVPLGPFDEELDSTYDFNWLSFPVGLKGNLALNKKASPGLYNFSLTGAASIASTSYYGEGVWNLRDDFEQSPSFAHEAEGYAVSGELGAVYQPIRYISIGGGYTFYSFEARDGTDTTYFSNGVTVDVPLDEVSSLRHGPYVFVSGQF